MSLQWLGFVGLALVMAAFMPQIVHLVRARCTAGVSLRAYLLWTTASLMIMAYAISIRDWVFMALQGYQLAANGAVFLLAFRHKGRLCSMHCGEEAPLPREGSFLGA